MSPQCAPWLTNCHTMPIATLCRKSCGICTVPKTTESPITVPAAECYDQLSLCAKWSNNCQFRNIQTLCPATCNVCATPSSTTKATTTTMATTSTVGVTEQRDPCADFASQAQCAFVVANDFCHVIGVREQCAGSCGVCQDGRKEQLDAPTEEQFVATEAITLATLTIATTDVEPRLCVDHIYCEVFADQCTDNRRSFLFSF